MTCWAILRSNSLPCSPTRRSISSNDTAGPAAISPLTNPVSSPTSTASPAAPAPRWLPALPPRTLPPEVPFRWSRLHTPGPYEEEASLTRRNATPPDANPTTSTSLQKSHTHVTSGRHWSAPDPAGIGSTPGGTGSGAAGGTGSGAAGGTGSGQQANATGAPPGIGLTSAGAPDRAEAGRSGGMPVQPHHMPVADSGPSQQVPPVNQGLGWVRQADRSAVRAHSAGMA